MSDSPSHHRFEAGVRSRGSFDLLIEGGPAVPASIVEVSPSGICLEAGSAIERDTRVRLEGCGVIANGVVRHCQRIGEAYRIGVSLSPPV
jgi:hypothetical protein